MRNAGGWYRPGWVLRGPPASWVPIATAARAVRGFGPAFDRLIPPKLPAAWAHVIRVVLGVWIALYLAYALQLDSPYWAVTTVLLVAHPVRGALFSKSLWRILGTTAGAVAMVALIAVFPQEPILFMAGVSVWLGVFTFIASLLRYFRAYGAVLAGMTVSLIAFGSVEHPETMLNVALARVAAVTIGTLSAAFVSLAFHASVGAPEIERRIGTLIGAVAHLLGAELRGQQDQSPFSEQARISAELARMDEVIEFASVESDAVRRRATAFRIGAAELFGALAAGSHTMPMLREAAAPMPWQPAADDPGVTILNEVFTEIARLPCTPEAGAGARLPRVILKAREALDALMRDGIDDPKGGDPRFGDSRVLAWANALELLDRLSRAARSLDAVRDEAGSDPIRLRAFLGWRTAFRNGLRAMIAMGLGCLFWVVTAWPSGASMLAVLGVMCGLLATNPSAAAASVDFAKGIALSAVLAFIYTFGILVHISGFPLLAVSLLPIVAGGAYASTKPRWTPVMIPLLIFFMPLVGPTNPMHYDVISFFNTAFAYVCGAICAVFAFRIILPPDAALNVERLCESIGHDVERLGRLCPVEGGLQWEHLQHQKLARLVERLRDAEAGRREAVLRGASAAITVGSAEIRVRAALTAGQIPKPVAAIAEEALQLSRDLRSNADAVAARSIEVSHLLLDWNAGAPRSVELVRTAAAFQRIGILIRRHRAFFQRRGASFRGDVTC